MWAVPLSRLVCRAVANTRLDERDGEKFNAFYVVAPVGHVCISRASISCFRFRFWNQVPFLDPFATIGKGLKHMVF